MIVHCFIVSLHASDAKRLRLVIHPPSSPHLPPPHHRRRPRDPTRRHRDRHPQPSRPRIRRDRRNPSRRARAPSRPSRRARRATRPRTPRALSRRPRARVRNTSSNRSPERVRIERFQAGVVDAVGDERARVRSRRVSRDDAESTAQRLRLDLGRRWDVGDNHIFRATRRARDVARRRARAAECGRRIGDVTLASARQELLRELEPMLPATRLRAAVAERGERRLHPRSRSRDASRVRARARTREATTADRSDAARAARRSYRSARDARHRPRDARGIFFQRRWNPSTTVFFSGAPSSASVVRARRSSGRMKTSALERARASARARRRVRVGLALTALGTVLTRTAHAAQTGTRCANDGSDYAYSESFVSNERVITFRLCPNHARDDAIGDNPNRATYTGTKTFKVPQNPMLESTAAATLAASPSKDLTAQGGGVGVLFNGAWMYSPYAGAPNTLTGYTTSATHLEGDTFDMCGCHSAGFDDSYHCHIPPICLLRQLGQTAGAHSPQIGWAADGFPIYGPLGPGGVEMKECTGATGSVWGTDACTKNGAYLKTDSSIDNYALRYYIQGNQAPSNCTNPHSDLPGSTVHPHTPTYFYGCCPSGQRCGSSTGPSLGIATCTSSAVSGQTSQTPVKTAQAIDCDSCWASSDGGSATLGSGCTSSSSSSSPSSSSATVDAAVAVAGAALAACLA